MNENPQPSSLHSNYPPGKHVTIDNFLVAVQYVAVVTISIDVSPVYGMRPVTWGGFVMSILMMYFGVIFMSMPIAIVGTCFSQTWWGRELYLA
jgi:hypothetical protein